MFGENCYNTNLLLFNYLNKVSFQKCKRHFPNFYKLLVCASLGNDIGKLSSEHGNYKALNSSNKFC